jgi:shikimate kinase
MGAGKTTIGREAARILHFDFVDLDRVVVERAGRSIEEIFRVEGEGRFREMEWEALQAVRGRTRTVVATGGGLFAGEAHREFIRAEGVSIWLDAPLPLILTRLRRTPGKRPLVDSEQKLRELFRRRREVYALADHHLKTGRRSVIANAERLLALIRSDREPSTSPGER